MLNTNWLGVEQPQDACQLEDVPTCTKRWSGWAAHEILNRDEACGWREEIELYGRTWRIQAWKEKHQMDQIDDDIDIASSEAT